MTPASQEQIFPIVLAFWQTRALAVATELGLPDLLAEGPLHVDDLASHFFVPCVLWKAYGFLPRFRRVHFCNCTLMFTCPPVTRSLLVQGFRPGLMMVTSCQQHVSSISAGVAPT